jgi:hypothetical protein
LYGYQIAIEKDNWGDIYKHASGDALAGTLVFKEGNNNNVPAPDPGLYFFDVDLKNLTYAVTAMGGEVYVSGLNDVWGWDTTLTATSTPGVYSGSVTLTGTTSHGMKFYLVSGNWDLVFGGGEGQLWFRGSDIPEVKTLPLGTYTVTVDLINGTYTIE